MKYGMAIFKNCITTIADSVLPKHRIGLFDISYGIKYHMLLTKRRQRRKTNKEGAISENMIFYSVTNDIILKI